MKSDKEHIKLNFLTSQIDFHSDKASAHAGFLVAIIFGLFSILNIYGNTQSNWAKTIILLLYGILWFSGAYCLLNFGYFSKLASSARHEIVLLDEKKLIDVRQRMWNLAEKEFARGLWIFSKPYLKVKKWEGRSGLILIVYVLVGIFSLIAVLL